MRNWIRKWLGIDVIERETFFKEMPPGCSSDDGKWSVKTSHILDGGALRGLIGRVGIMSDEKRERFAKGNFTVMDRLENIEQILQENGIKKLSGQVSESTD